MNMAEVGKQIQVLRKMKGLTQSELGSCIGVSFQAVSKWERGETLPDTALLPELAGALGTSVDNILLVGRRDDNFQRKITISQVREAIACFTHIGELLGTDNHFYTGAVEGVDHKMHLDMHAYLQEPFTREALIAEATIQCIQNGSYVDPTDIQKNIQNTHWQNVILDHAEKYGIGATEKAGSNLS